MVRDLAGGDPEKSRRVFRWPLRDALLARVSQMKREALEAYRFEMIVYALTAPYAKKAGEPPKPHKILKE